jgi:hypothetical protein
MYVAAAVYAAVVLWQYPRWTVDDAYIVFRYARHLVDHGQLTWNLASDPVEGYTGVAWPLIVAAGMRVGLSPRLVTLVIGCASYFLAAWTLRANQRRLGVPEPVRACVTTTTMLFPPLFAHATSGLETMLFAAMLGTCFGALLDCTKSPRPRAQAYLWLELLVLSLLRPEGLLFACAFGCALAVTIRHDRGALRVGAAIAFGAFALPYGAYFAWRASYYGRFFPNTYYAKAAASGFDAGFLKSTVGLVNLFSPLLVAAVACAVLIRKCQRPPLWPTLAVAVSLAALAAQYSRSSLIMDYLYRFQIHTLFLVLPFVGVLLAGAAESLRLPQRYGAARGGLLLALLGTCVLGWSVESLASESKTRAYAQRYLDVESEQHARVAEWLNAHLSPSDSVACWVDAGIIPYLADDHEFIDFGRLNDEYLARRGISRQDLAEYFFSRRPGALVLTSDAALRSPQHDAAVVTDDPRFAAYERTLTVCSPEHPEAACEILFLRRGVTTP